RAGAGHVVVFSNEVGKRDRQVAGLHVIHPKAIPRRRAISAALILLAEDMHAKCRLIHLLDPTDRAALEGRAKGHLRRIRRRCKNGASYSREKCNRKLQGPISLSCEFAMLRSYNGGRGSRDAAPHEKRGRRMLALRIRDCAALVLSMILASQPLDE